jgi:hypothetical protein
MNPDDLPANRLLQASSRSQADRMGSHFRQPAVAAVAAAEVAPDSFFLSRAWHDACLESWSGRARFRRIEFTGATGTPVEALIGERTEVRHGVLPVRVLALNQSTLPDLDQPWIERNGFFGGRPEHFDANLARLLELLCEEPGWDEIRLGGLTSDHAHQALYLAARNGLSSRLDLEQPSYSIDLDAIRTRHGGDYLAALSGNTRQQLRRTRRLVERELGPLRLTEAATVEQAHAWLDATAPLHRARWGSADAREFDSGFDNPAFVEFHHRLIEHAFPTRAVQYLRLEVADRTFAYLYNFVAEGHVHFYLSGIDYGVGEAYRPGLMAHWLAIERNLEAGNHVYDFLAGDARYKRSLSTGQDRTLWLVLQRPRWRLQLEGFARRVKRSWLGDDPDDLARIPEMQRAPLRGTRPR